MKTNVENVEAQRRKAYLTMQRLAMVARSKDLTDQEQQEFDEAEQEVADCDKSLEGAEGGRCPPVAPAQASTDPRASVGPGYRHIGGNVFVANASPAQARGAAPPAARPTPDPAQVVIDAYCAARTDAVSGKGGGPGTLQARMRVQLARDGIKPAA